MGSLLIFALIVFTVLVYCSVLGFRKAQRRTGVAISVWVKIVIVMIIWLSLVSIVALCTQIIRPDTQHSFMLLGRTFESQSMIFPLVLCTILFSLLSFSLWGAVFLCRKAYYSSIILLGVMSIISLVIGLVAIFQRKLGYDSDSAILLAIILAFTLYKLVKSRQYPLKSEK